MVRMIQIGTSKVWTSKVWTTKVWWTRCRCVLRSVIVVMPSSHCMILARFFTRRQVLINRRQMAEIGGKLELVHASDNRTVWIIKDAIWGNRRCVADAHEIFGMLNIWSCWRIKIPLCEWVLTEKYIADDLQPMREQDTGQWEVRGGLLIFL